MSKKVVSILGCGWLGKPLGAALINEGYLVMGSTSRHENIGALKAAGIVPLSLMLMNYFQQMFVLSSTQMFSSSAYLHGLRLERPGNT